MVSDKIGISRSGVLQMGDQPETVIGASLLKKQTESQNVTNKQPKLTTSHSKNREETS